jgi:hypothetical protein
MKKQKSKLKKSGGYIAISSVLVILAVTLTIFISVTLLSIDGAQISLSRNLSQKSINIVDGCVADALLYLNNNNSLPATITLPEGVCTVTQNSQTGDNWVFTTSANIEGFSNAIMVDVDRTGTIIINSWQEV